MRKSQTEIVLVVKTPKSQIKTSVETLTSRRMTHRENSELETEDKVESLNHSVKVNEKKKKQNQNTAEL